MTTSHEINIDIVVEAIAVSGLLLLALNLAGVY